MDHLARSPIGKITLQSMVRRHALWVLLNSAVSISLYFLVRCVAKFGYAKFGVNTDVFSGLEFIIYISISVILLVQIYTVYVADGAKFGGTNITLRAHVLPLTWIIPSVLGALSGKYLLDLVHWSPVTPISLISIRLNLHLIPALSGVVALLVFFNFPPSPRALQTTPQPIAHSFVGQFVKSLQQAVVRGAKIAVTVSVLFFAVRAVEHFLLTWTCTASPVSGAVQANPLCNLFVSKDGSLSVYLPASSIWVDVASSLFVAVLLLFKLDLSLQTLSFLSTYPLDFQKLRLQLLYSEGGVRSGSSSVPSEQLLLQALLIGQESGTSTTASGPVSFSSSNYSENTALSEAQVQETRQALLVDSVVSVGMLPPVVPYFGEGTDLITASTEHRKFPTNVINNPNSNSNAALSAYTAPRKVLQVGKFDLLARSLAFQDLQRLVVDPSEVAAERRSVLFAKHWAQVLAATCGMIDATALQVHLLDDFLTKPNPVEDLPQEELDSLLVPESAALAGSVAPGVPRPSTSFENMQRLRASLASPHSPQRNPDDRHDKHAVSSSIERDQGGLRPRLMYSRNKEHHHSDSRSSENAEYAREVRNASKFLTGLQEWAYLSFYSALHVPVPGYGVQYAADLPVRAFPPMCAASAVYAIQSVCALLLLALTEDSSGYTQRSVCPVVRSLLTLETALSAYCSTLQASQFVRISSMGRTQQIRYRARSESAIPDAIRSLQHAVQEGLGKVVRAYRDVLLIVVTQYDSQATAALFSRTQVTALEAKLLAIA